MHSPTASVCDSEERKQTNLAGWRTVSGVQSQFLPHTEDHPPSAQCHLVKEEKQERFSVFTCKETFLMLIIPLKSDCDGRSFQLFAIIDS